MSNQDQQLVMCDDRLPVVNGNYKVKNNSGCNNGEGLIYFDTEKGWDFPNAIKNFYKVIGWYENNESQTGESR